MKTDLSKLDLETFFVTESNEIGGEKLFLVNPKRIGLGNWNKDNLWFRSSMWNEQGELVSVGFPKFANWGEKPDIFPVPSELKNLTFIEKMDGSLLTVTKYKGNLIARTRGTFNARQLANGDELEIFDKEIVPKLESFHDYMLGKSETWGYSVLFEWISPKNTIVVHSKTTRFVLIGIIDHNSGSMFPQGDVDIMGAEYGIERPKRFFFKDEETSSADELLKVVKSWTTLEGIVVYSNGDQTLHKIKSDWYCQLHKSKSDLSNLNKVMDKWFELEMPDKQTFYNWVEKEYDFELAESTSVLIDEVLQLRKEALELRDQIKSIVDPIRHLSKRDFALTIMPQYGKSGFSSFYFDCRDEKALTKESLKKLMEKIKEKTS